MTFSITGRCARTGMFGIGVTTSSVCVTSRCAWARAGVGAVATQNITNPALGVQGLDLLAEGLSARAVVDWLVAGEKFPAYRQIGIIGREGEPAYYSGDKTLGTFNETVGRDCLGLGNLLANKDVPVSMVQTFDANPDEHLAERLLRALEEGLVAGGEVGQVRSAGLYVVDKYVWPICDLRVDWSDAPIGALRTVWTEYEPQMAAYLTRALDPPSAPSYGVPGDI